MFPLKFNSCMEKLTDETQLTRRVGTAVVLTKGVLLYWLLCLILFAPKKL